MGLQFQRVDVDHDLAVFAAVGRRDGRAGNARDLIANLVLQDSRASCVSFSPCPSTVSRQTGRLEASDLQHHRGKRSLRKPAQVRHGQVGNLRDVGVGIRARLEVDLDQAHAGHGPRFHVIDAAAQREESLERVGDVRLDLLRAACRCRTWPPAQREY